MTDRLFKATPETIDPFIVEQLRIPKKRALYFSYEEVLRERRELTERLREIWELNKPYSEIREIVKELEGLK